MSSSSSKHLLSRRRSSSPPFTAPGDLDDPFAPPLSAHATTNPAEPVLLLTIRPSHSIPDIHLDVASPSTTSVARLKQQIRQRLGGSHRRAKIRLIYQGRILEDGAVLSRVVKAPPPPPPRSDETSGDGTGKGKGKDNAKGKGKGKGKEPAPALPRVFINASIGDVLSKEELEKEDKLARRTVKPELDSVKKGIKGPAGVGTSAAGAGAPSGQTGGQGSSTTPQPRGFDRLLSTGFSRSEVNALRLQFRSIQESHHTADSMPSPDTLRNLEDAWIDGNAFAPSAANPLGTAGPGAIPGVDDDGAAAAMGSEEDEAARLVDIMLMAAAIGFFWPMGTVAWLARQKDGTGRDSARLWSQNWHFLAIVGVFCSVVISLVKGLVGEGE